ncbi:phosphatidate cytidylyltransferase [Pseudomonas gingeri]|uniref:Phosphatidate cytidylyltransferase n=1 Tax=Pseudomonas gingeri TaxID=117681 RepID=A0A7Y7X771_9PSED|nr:phosphatidate cytidylyltransferase [Pseudomonas gingeri]NWA23650.1 phosphatidate cytidylyltransferase [Pseudomonas gingeri]NWB94554.1 phosphatidate cytidylyltransferase [Pseudomonas gingeri]NWD68250.1 phosphatidate cytidylyltransferase [Pseudomonas gingeri]NWD73348.1 phosphatidate cytidylyltransferase [Pseudomonas gingeri]
MLKQRIITALILLPIALCGFFLLSGSGFALFIGVVVTLGAWEWARLAGFEAQSSRVAYAAVVAVLLFFMYILPVLAPWVLGASVIWWGLATYLVLTYPQTSAKWSSAASKLVIGFVILLPAWQGLIEIKQDPSGQGNLLIMAVMILVWGADIGAYFSGKAFGKRKLAPAVSPGKSWEGAYGGLVLSLVITAAVGVVRGWSIGEIVASLMGAAIIVFISVVGDLTESMFKRQSGVKDSSNLLPGHGGVLDRIDSLTAAIPMFAVLLWIAGS